jgi:receptor protein-tyrosine kinase
MTEAVMGAGLLHSPDETRTSEREETRPQAESLSKPKGWDPESFAREQIRGLVRQVFFSNGPRPVRQVVLSALEPETDVRSLCWRVGEALARETPGGVAVVGGYPRLIPREVPVGPRSTEPCMPLRQIATRVRGNLWLVPDGMRSGDLVKVASLRSLLDEVRRQFDYSIVQGPAGESNETAAMAQSADGIILVLSAQRTRRAAARKVKETLQAAQARILGTVLDDRVFPIPEAIYRRL